MVMSDQSSAYSGFLLTSQNSTKSRPFLKHSLRAISNHHKGALDSIWKTYHVLEKNFVILLAGTMQDMIVGSLKIRRKFLLGPMRESQQR
jgi:hypothetical protein